MADQDETQVGDGSVGAREFAEAGLDDWRFLLGRIEAQFRAGSFDGAASFALAVAEEANQANHHPDIDIRYPDRAFIALMTHATGGLTSLDLELATVISELARKSGLTSEPLPINRVEIAIDALDIGAIRPFWAAVLGYQPADPTPSMSALVDPSRVGPSIWFQQMDEPRPQRNRIHLDITVPHDQAEARVADALAAGGDLVSAERAKAFWILCDSEGNEACICTWQDRD